ncbi:peptide ABC transporter permease [Methanobrevibacter sp.]|uniref:peptide ABC transporter permease n=1 Tax=Methanobrevibacter sp. TaxID=66852 RepID=UPI0025F9280C|nr:peptide ABC transporter permease [Methanobrevibacter sp.]MBR4447134.1 peptide ABC transporter permease [Methanobrevibacter sp.]
MDLIGGYLLILLVLFCANIALFFGNYKLNNVKLIIISAIFSVISFLLIYASSYLNTQLEFLLSNFSYIFLIITAIILVSLIYYIKTYDFKLPFYAIILTFLISIVLFASQANLSILTMLLYSLFVFVILFVVYQLTRLLRHAKREYPVIVGEYMSLFAVLMFIFTLTYYSTITLDYTMFSSFLILTPTYQLIYVVIGIIAVLIVGVLINDTKGGNS